MKKKFVTKLATLLGISLALNNENSLVISDENRQKLTNEFSDKTDAVIHAAELELQYEKAISEKDSELAEKTRKLAALQAKHDTVVSQLAEANIKIDTLMGQSDGDTNTVINLNTSEDRRWMGGSHTEKHIFGLAHEFYSKDKWYNRLTVERKVSHKRKQAELAELDADFAAYGESLAGRFATLQETGQLDRMIAGGDIDYSGLSASLGNYYYVRRQDALIAYILTLPSVTDIFPLQYGVQDGQVLVDVFEGASFSQAYKSGEVPAGSFKLEPHVARVKDVMFKYLFHDLKDLETQYIGYLNQEGSGPVKLSFIEWIMQRCSEIIVNEKNQRRITGVRIEPYTSNTKPSFFMFGSDGILTTKDRYIQENRVYVFADKNVYTKSTIIDYFDSMADEVMQMRGVGTLSGMVMYFNANHIKMYLDAHHDAHHVDANYNGDRLEIKNINGLVLKGVPNMGRERYDVWITSDKNFECLENVAGEMFGFYFERRLENLWSCSYGKEGTAAIKPGRAYTSAQAVKDAEGRHTTIFANKPFTALAAGATTADAKANRYFCSIANTGATVFTAFTSAKQGVLYKLECGSITNATTITKAAKMANITAAWTPTAVGDYISLIYDKVNDLYYEYDRMVGGVYTKNTALRAPEYVEAI